MKNTKKFLALLLAFIMLAVSVPVAYAAITGGSFGADQGNLYWQYGGDGVLKISGFGAMEDFSESNSPWSDLSQEITSVIIEEGVTSIGSGAFSGFSDLTQAQLPSTISSIGAKAFESCSKLADITIPQGVKEISEKTFYECKALESISLPDSVTAIGDYAFSGCDKLAQVKLSSKLTTIGDYAFYYCISLKNIDLPSTLTSIGAYAFDGCSSLLSVVIPEGVTAIAESTFNNCAALKTVSIPESVTSIGMLCFANCVSLVDVKLPENLTTIERHAFYYCSALTEIVIPEKVTKLAGYLFVGCHNLKSAAILCPVEELPASLFRNCYALSDLILPENIATIRSYTFENCDSLYTVHFLGKVTHWSDLDVGSSNDAIMGANKHSCRVISETKANCLTPGVAKGWYCDDCKAYIMGGETDEAPDYNNHVNPLPTYSLSENDSTKHIVTYSCCNTSVTQEHSFENYTVTASATCTENAIETGVCICGLTDTREAENTALGHNEGYFASMLPTCTIDGLSEGVFCTRCDEILVAQTVIPARGHSYRQERTEPTCTEKGKVVYTCFCGYSYEEELAATGHKEAVIEGKQATCNETGLTQGKFCSVCKLILLEQTVIPMTQHKDEDGDYLCDYGCNYEFEKPEAPDTPDVPDAPDTPNAPDTPDVPDTPEKEYCDHLCHSDNWFVKNVVWKFVRFFWKLFRMNPVCDCGVRHY